MKSILIIDDDEEICEELADILRDDGYRVTVVHNGLDGKALVEQGGYDAVLLDLKMPGLSGYDILKAARAAATRAKLLVVSGRPFIRKYLPGEDTVDREKKEDLLKLADGFINKPFNIAHLLSLLREVTASAE